MLEMLMTAKQEQRNLPISFSFICINVDAVWVLIKMLQSSLFSQYIYVRILKPWVQEGAGV